MKNTKTKIVSSVVIFLAIVGFAGTVTAAESSLYVSPSKLTKIVGNIFGASVSVNTSGNKVCAVEGTVVFNNLSCQSIMVVGDVIPQSVPTCLNSHFLIGVPNCTVTDKALFTISAKAETAGASSISFTGVDIIGEGISLGSASKNGSYVINTAPVSAPTQTAARINVAKSATTTATSTETTPQTATVALSSLDKMLTLGTGSPAVASLMTIVILAIIGGGIWFWRRSFPRG